MNIDLFINRITELEDGILEVEGLPNGIYDEQAVKYDKLISNGLYNRLMWGNSPKDYSAFCKQAMDREVGGITADIGCGTLSFTAEVYAKNHKHDMFLCDLSYEMLKIGKSRLVYNEPDLSKTTFLRSDALDMPFVNNSIQTILSFGFFHVINNSSDLMIEFSRILKSGGKLYITSLCTDRKLSAKYLNFLHKKKHVSQPLGSNEIIKIIEQNGFIVENSTIKGGMVYITAIKQKTTHNKDIL